MKINPMIFKSMEEADNYKKSLKKCDWSIQTELDGGKVLTTYVLEGIKGLEEWDEVFHIATQVHTAALSGYMASGGLLKGEKQDISEERINYIMGLLNNEFKKLLKSCLKYSHHYYELKDAKKLLKELHNGSGSYLDSILKFRLEEEKEKNE